MDDALTKRRRTRSPGLKSPVQFCFRGLAVDEESVARHVRKISRVHAHLAPLHAITDRGAKTVTTGVAEEVEKRALMEIVVAGIGLEIAQDLVWILAREVGEDDEIIALGPDDIASLGLDDDRAVETTLFLGARMGVVPIGAALADREAVGEGLGPA